MMGAAIGSQPSVALASDMFAQDRPARIPLKTKCSKASQENVLPRELLSTYLQYAKRYAHPTLSKGARALIKKFYMERRRGDHSASATMPVTPRQLEALIRLSEARARAELRRVVLRSDVEDVIEIIMSGMEMETSLPTVACKKGKKGANGLVERLREYMERRVRCGNGREFSEKQLREYAGTGIKEIDFDKALQRLNEQENVLLLRASGTYEFTGA